MAHSVTISRRFVLKAGLAVGGGLLLDVHVPNTVRAATPVTGADAPFTPNAFIRIDKAGDVMLIMRETEVGQGTHTSIAMLIAEELEVGVDQVSIEAAPPDIKLYINPLLDDQATGGLASIRVGWMSMREAGAVARTVLIAAAAAKWQVDTATCSAQRAVVTHAVSERTAGYGALAEAAAKQPVLANVALKDANEFKLIGTSSPPGHTGQGEWHDGVHRA